MKTHNHDKIKNHTHSGKANAEISVVTAPETSYILTLAQKQALAAHATDHASLGSFLKKANEENDNIIKAADKLGDSLCELGRALVGLEQKIVELLDTRSDPALDGITVGDAFYYICSRELRINKAYATTAIKAAMMEINSISAESVLSSVSARQREKEKRKQAHSFKKAQLVNDDDPIDETKSKVAQPAPPKASSELHRAVSELGAPVPSSQPSGYVLPRSINSLKPKLPVKPSKLPALLSPLMSPEFQARVASGIITETDLGLIIQAACGGLFLAKEYAAERRLKPTGYKRKKPLPVSREKNQGQTEFPLS